MLFRWLAYLNDSHFLILFKLSPLKSLPRSSPFLCSCSSSQEKTSCLPGCFCHGEEVWETEELFLNSLQELYICGFNGSDYDFAFVKRLLGWARMLKSVHIKFDPQETVDEELCKELLGLSGPKTCMKIYLYRNGAKVMYTPVG